MKYKFSLVLLLPLLMFLNEFCAKSVEKSGTGENPEMDSVAATNVPDTSKQLSQYFDRNGETIPLAFCGQVLKIQNIEQTVSRCYSVKRTKNQGLDIFIIGFDCTAGGFCERKELIVFNKAGNAARLHVGLDMTDQTFQRKIQYEFLADDLIELKKSEKRFDLEGHKIRDSTYSEYYEIESSGVLKKTSKRQ